MGTNDLYVEGALVESIPSVGGMLAFADSGVATCMSCNWRGVPLQRFRGTPTGEVRRYQPGFVARGVEGGAPSTFCPVCERDSLEAERAFDAPPEQRRGVKVSRNAPCPCGSGRKAKKCCHG